MLFERVKLISAQALQKHIVEPGTCCVKRYSVTNNIKIINLLSGGNGNKSGGNGTLTNNNNGGVGAVRRLLLRRRWRLRRPRRLMKNISVCG